MPKLLPLKLFLKTFEYVPRLAISLVVANRNGEVLLARRAMSPKKGFWHLPGGFVLRDESLRRCTQRVVKKELGVTISSTAAKFMGVFENLHKDPRGHVVDLVYKMKIDAPRPTEETQEVKYFKKLPSSIAFGHSNILRKLGY